MQLDRENNLHFEIRRGFYNVSAVFQIDISERGCVSSCQMVGVQLDRKSIIERLSSYVYNPFYYLVEPSIACRVSYIIVREFL